MPATLHPPDRPASPGQRLAARYGVETVALRGMALHAVTEARCARIIFEELGAGRGGWVVTPNLDILRRVSAEARVRRLVERADLVLADGMPLVWASRLRGTPLPARVPGSTLVEKLAQHAAAEGRSLFLLGGDPGVAKRAGDALVQQYPGLRIAGTYCPPMGFEQDPGAIAGIREALARARPDLVYVALGFPKQERLIDAVRDTAPGAWWLGVGISLSFLSGAVQRAPRWVQAIGMEWAHRMAQEPGRLTSRYLVHDLPFAARLLAGSTLARWRGPGSHSAAAEPDALEDGTNHGAAAEGWGEPRALPGQDRGTAG